MSKDVVVSNCLGEEATPIDRLYGDLHGKYFVVQKDFTHYKGKIHKKGTLVKGLDGNRFRSHCFVTDDNRWFDRCGMPIAKPSNLVNDE
jgi:hypothetical protein